MDLLDGPDQMKSSNQLETAVPSAFGDQLEDQHQEVSSKDNLEIAGSSHQLHLLLKTQKELRESSLTPKPVQMEFTKLNSNHTVDQFR